MDTCRLDRALLMRHKDGKLRLAKKCGAGFHTAAQCQPDVTVFVQLMRHKAANLRLTKKCGTGFPKAAQNPKQSSG